MLKFFFLREAVWMLTGTFHRECFILGIFDFFCQIVGGVM